MTFRHIQALLVRARRMGPRRAIARMRPVRINELLYELRPKADGDAPVHPTAIGIRRFDATHPSPWAAINARLTPARAVYLVADGDVIAHQSWVMSDVVNPGAFGFDATIPVVGECETDQRYRGRGLYRETLCYIARDLARREGREFVYITVAPDNGASIRGIEEAGAFKLAELRGWRVLTFAWPRARMNTLR